MLFVSRETFGENGENAAFLKESLAKNFSRGKMISMHPIKVSVHPFQRVVPSRAHSPCEVWSGAPTKESKIWIPRLRFASAKRMFSEQLCEGCHVSALHKKRKHPIGCLQKRNSGFEPPFNFASQNKTTSCASLLQIVELVCSSARVLLTLGFAQKKENILLDAFFFYAKGGIRTLGRLLAEHTISSRAP